MSGSHIGEDTLDIDTLADQLELERTVWTLGRCLDERDFDGLRQIFTCDATVTTRETASGHDALVEQARRRHSRDDGIQHTWSLNRPPE